MQHNVRMASPDAVVAKKRILIVDDDDATHALLNAMLRSADRDIESAFNGQEALSKVLAHSYDLVLTDINMPLLDGLALLIKIRAARPEMMVVVMTAESTPERVVASIREQAHGYVTKPFSRETIANIVDSALSASIAPDDVEVISARPGWISLRLRCKLGVADRLTQFFLELVADIDPEEREGVSTAFRELLTNAIEHGGHSDPRQWVSLTYMRGARSIMYYIRDPGEGFSFENLPHAAVSNRPGTPFEHSEIRDKLGMRPGGFGILMTRNFADEVLYSQKGNEVMLIKYLS
jgi:CheY-like chemotaxis protein/anti-sigma regulatory factor (Ser/Thr protein kinase)